MKRRLILASASPRRIEMFRKNGIEAEICPSNLQERLPEGISPEQTVLYLSLGKALDVERRFLEKNPLPEERVFILGADTVVFTNRILGKPKDEEEAFEMLKSLCGGEHRVLTGVSIVEAGTVNRKSFFESTKVRTKSYSDEDRRRYIATGEPMDKAGAYAIQGGFSAYIDGFDGDYDNVIGLPWKMVREELEKMGFILQN